MDPWGGSGAHGLPPPPLKLHSQVPAHEGHLIPARTIRTDTSEKRREILRCRFGGFGWCQRLKLGVGVFDVVLDPIQPCPIIVRESDTSPGGLHERLGGAGWPSHARAGAPAKARWDPHRFCFGSAGGPPLSEAPR